MAWQNGLGIYARSFDAQGLPLGSQALVVPPSTNKFTYFDLTAVALGLPGASGQIGNYVLTWFNSYASTFNVQSFGSNNQPAGQVVSLPAVPTYGQPPPESATDAAGNFVIVASNGENLTAQFFLANGTARTGVIPLPVSTAADPNGGFANADVQLVSDAAGNFTIAWYRYQVNPTPPYYYTYTPFVQRFAGLN
jgi:hypothetical protein